MFIILVGCHFKHLNKWIKIFRLCLSKPYMKVDSVYAYGFYVMSWILGPNLFGGKNNVSTKSH